MAVSSKFRTAIFIILLSALCLEAYFLLREIPVLSNAETLIRSKISFDQDRLLAAVKNDFFITSTDGKKSFPISPEVLGSWLSSEYKDFIGRRSYRLDSEKIKQYLVALPIDFADQSADGLLGVDSQNRLTEYSASRKGEVLNVNESVSNIISALNRGNNWARLAFDEITPKVSLARAKELGINTLLGTGSSDFVGSTESRVLNIKVGAAIFNGYILKPGEEFSFNTILGPVDASGGYKPEMVVKDHKIFPEYGGGLCQVSTTVFRAAYKAGLPITERHNHSLALRYYTPQGFDATIYPDISDLRFVNDTPGNVLIQSEVKGTKISFQIFGAGDGRTIAIDGPRTLSSDGSGNMKTILGRTVTYADGVQKKDSFFSEYRNAALYPTVKNPLE